jgi:hypothetical protein
MTENESGSLKGSCKINRAEFGGSSSGETISCLAAEKGERTNSSPSWCSAGHKENILRGPTDRIFFLVNALVDSGPIAELIAKIVGTARFIVIECE